MPHGAQTSIWLAPERSSRAGRKPSYSREQITKAAIAVADAEGLEAASMRRVAAEVGTGAMSLYRYAPSRSDLIELMVDAVTGELDLPERPTGDWRADLTVMAHGVKALGLRHPWLMQLAQGHPVLGPNTLGLIEFSLGALDGHGLPIDEMISMHDLLYGYVRNFVQGEVAWLEDQRRTGVSRAQWMADNAHIRQLVESGRYPMFTRMVNEARQPHMSTDSRFDYGLDRVLDNIAASLPDS